MNKYTRLVVLFIAVILVSFHSCKIGKKYQQPDLSLPADYKGAIDSNWLDSTNLAEIPWREFFNDSTLISLIEKGLIYNFDMQKALRNIEISNRNLRINKYQYLPSVDLNVATVNKQYRSKDFYGNPAAKWYENKGSSAPESMSTYQSQFSTGLGFSWEIDTWGKIAQEKDLLKASFFNTEEVKNAIQTKLISDIASGYFNLLMLDAQIGVAKKNTALNDSTLHMIQLQFDAGEITALALQQTKSQQLVAASLVPELEKEIAIQENALSILLGHMPHAISRKYNMNEMLVKFHEDISLGSPLDIIRNRPDIKQAELSLIQANAEMNIRQIMRYPKLSLNSTFGLNSMLPENWFNIPGALFGGIVGDISAPLFKGKKLKNDYEVAKIQREKAELSFQQQVMEAIAEVSNSIITVQKQKEQLAYAEESVLNSELAVKNAALLFKSGYATYLEVITAQSNALRSELDLVALKQKQLNAYVSLYRSLGGGWK